MDVRLFWLYASNSDSTAEAGLHTFVISASDWIEKAGTIGVYTSNKKIDCIIV